MPTLRVAITKFLDDHQPGFVECELQDVRGVIWIFHEKVPIVCVEDLNASSTYPQSGTIDCAILNEFVDSEGRHILTVNTETPWHVEATDGTTVFDVLAEQVGGR